VIICAVRGFTVPKRQEIYVMSLPSSLYVQVLKGNVSDENFCYEASLLYQNIYVALHLKREHLILFPCEAVATGKIKRLGKDRLMDIVMK
jgi:hypothetical protein